MMSSKEEELPRSCIKESPEADKAKMVFTSDLRERICTKPDEIPEILQWVESSCTLTVERFDKVESMK